MFNKSINEGGLTHVTAPNGVSRAEIAVNAPTGIAELPGQAVAASSGAHGLPSDGHGRGSISLEFLRIRAAVDALHNSKEDAERLEKLREKLTLGYHSAKELDLIPLDLEDTLSEVEARTDLVLGGKKREADSVPSRSKPRRPDEALSGEDQKRVIAEIEAALERIGAVKDILQQGEDDGYNQLLNLNALVSGLNSARTQVDNSDYSVSAASVTVETIMINMRSAIVAHGAASPDMVRIVLAS